MFAWATGSPGQDRPGILNINKYILRNNVATIEVTPVIVRLVTLVKQVLSMQR